MFCLEVFLCYISDYNIDEQIHKISVFLQDVKKITTLNLKDNFKRVNLK